jgi:hypothetical protein
MDGICPHGSRALILFVNQVFRFSVSASVAGFNYFRVWRRRRISRYATKHPIKTKVHNSATCLI